jgi:hypothetical protein
LAMWERLGKPDHDALMGFAAGMDVDEEDPKWKKRLKLTARYEVEVARQQETMMTESNEMLQGQGQGADADKLASESERLHADT